MQTTDNNTASATVRFRVTDAVEDVAEFATLEEALTGIRAGEHVTVVAYREGEGSPFWGATSEDQALKHNTRKKALQGLQRLAEEITEEHLSLGVFHLHEDKLLLEKLEDLLQILEENYSNLVE